jgi:hypothetical protein
MPEMMKAGAGQRRLSGLSAEHADPEHTVESTQPQASTTRPTIRVVSALLSAAEARAVALPEPYRATIVEALALAKAQTALSDALGGGAPKRSGGAS